MKLTDLKNGSTWVVGIQGFSSALFIRATTPRERRNSMFPHSMSHWAWTDNLLRAIAFDSREDAERLRSDPMFDAFLARTMPRTELARVRALKVELRVGV